MKTSRLETKFITLWRSLHPSIELESEVLLIPTRKYRVDFAHLISKTVIEVQGGVWGRGAHSTGKGLNRDYEKYNFLQLEGFSVFQLSSDMIKEDWLNAIANFILCRMTQ